MENETQRDETEHKVDAQDTKDVRTDFTGKDDDKDLPEVIFRDWAAI
ncbi:hypothetical protein [Litoreibacter roseus]|uniref:Uncharacterized protein n=1 Tax=Litoreibacter roseus TaxID=2601869 RepID=A0A6N6JD43_9RHOB|nr:hypothetical protein [Litoreibacter roseus]GFE64075.1 hypothetical protein KIN_11490 [Litoreibacter roseus]